MVKGFKATTQGIRTVFRDRSSWKIAIFAGVAIAYVYYWLFYKVSTVPEFFSMARNGDFGTHSTLYSVLYWTTTLATIVFFAIAAAILVWLWRHSQLQKLASGSLSAGAFVGALGSACPVCGAFLLSFFGVSSGVSTMPFQGLELKLASLGLMIGSTMYAGRKVEQAKHCEECNDITEHAAHVNRMKHSAPAPASEKGFGPWDKVLIPILMVLFITNQFMITRTAAQMGLSTGVLAQLVGIKTVAAKTIIAPKLNPDGRTTSLVEQPTITEVLANPNTGDALADAKVVMLATGKPFYAPEDVAFDDPINAQQKWGAYERSIQLSGDLQTRYDKLIRTMVCSYCCGSPTSVTLNYQCGCAHSKAVRGFYKYMLQTYSDQYSDDEIVGESHRWYAIWYPKGMLEDYLLATGKGDVMGHKTHGGAGSDGRHGL